MLQHSIIFYVAFCPCGVSFLSKNWLPWNVFFTRPW